MCEENTPQLNTKYNRKLIEWNDVKLFFLGVFYTVLFKLGLGWKFNRWLCKKGKYRKFSDGRCMWCGEKH